MKTAVYGPFFVHLDMVGVEILEEEFPNILANGIFQGNSQVQLIQANHSFIYIPKGFVYVRIIQFTENSRNGIPINFPVIICHLAFHRP